MVGCGCLDRADEGDMKMSGAGEAHSNEEPVEVIVQVRADVADALRGDALSSREARDLLAAAEEAGVTLTPVHPEADDAVSASYYRFDARDLDDAALVETLLATNAVEAAYPKPRAVCP